ncbi:hypothetical protein BC830DRAFT_1067786 [Chytriomyces sp. MP71]|nr:hypothetical protein BC830DRAFT_1067786 [Chytriomyces sp. MP71]
MATELSRLIIASYEGEYLDTEPAIPELLIPEVKVLDEGLAPLDEANPIESLKTDDTSSIESSGDIQQAAPENKASAPASIRDTRLFHGGGHAVFNSGSKYTGAFSLGFMHGKGVFNWKSGLCYEGDFDNNSITGEGAFTWSNGSKYTGHVKNGLRNGHGVFECSSNGEHVQYDGEWKNAKLNGFGKLVYNQSGTCFYEGTWLAGLKHGKGTMHYISGNIYKGEWYHNIKQGHGKMIWFDRGEEYQGHWANGLPHGYGVYTWKIARAQAHQLPVQNKYEGEWVQGKRNGFGVFTYASGANYSGEWRDNLKHGKGSCIFENGRTFIGEFKNDRPVLEAPRYQNELPFIFSLKGICPPNVDTVTIEENLKSINTVILRHIDDLRQIYSYYSSIVVSDDNESLDNRAITRIQLWKFFEDCGLRQRGHSFVALDRAYVAHLKDDPLLEGLYKDPHNVTHHFIFRDFLDVILRISFLVYKGTTPSAFSMHEYGPAASFNHMIKADVLGVLAKRGNAIARASAAASAAEPVAPGALEDVDEDMIGPVADSMTESNAGALLFVEMERKFSAGVYELYSQLAALHFRETVTIRILLHFLNVS